MSALNWIANALFLRLAFKGILLHGALCIGAIAMILASPFVLMDFTEDIRITNQLVKEGEIISVPLANRDKEHRDPHSGHYICYLELPNSVFAQEYGPPIRFLTPYLRASPVSGLDHLQIYWHPSLNGTGDVLPRIVEASSAGDWQSVFRAVRGESLFYAITLLGLKFLLMVATCYASVKIYFLIKGGPRRRRRRRI